MSNNKPASIKIAEIFYSIQGEGMYAGVPSVFIRTFGCNFECRGFGLPAGQVSSSPEAIAQDINKYDSYEKLPLAETGCDSYASWHPKFKHLSPKMTIPEIIEKVNDSIFDARIGHTQASGNGVVAPVHDTHIIITGGEPLLGWQRAYPELFDALYAEGFRNITFETNGTQELSPDFKDYLLINSIKNKQFDLTFSVSAKLPCSGESWGQAIRPGVVSSYEAFGKAFLKFVVATESDVHDAITAADEYRQAGFTGPVYLMPAGGTTESFNLNDKQVAEAAMAYGLRYSPRLQVTIWQNAWGT